MKKRLLPRQADLALLLSITALICTGGERPSPCSAGMEARYPTHLGGKSSIGRAEVSSLDFTAICVKQFDNDGNSYYQDSDNKIYAITSLTKSAEDAKAQVAAQTARENADSLPPSTARLVATGTPSTNPRAGQHSACSSIGISDADIDTFPAPRKETASRPDNLPTRALASAGSEAPKSAQGASARAASSNSTERPDPILSSNPPSPPGSTLSQVNSNTTSTINLASDLGDIATGNELIEAAKQSRLTIQRSAESDNQTLAEPLRKLSVDELQSALAQAKTKINQDVDVISGASSTSLESSDRARFLNYIRNAQDKVDLALDAIHDDKSRENQLGANSPFTGVFGMKDGNPLAKLASLADIFGSKLPTSAAATTQDSLTNRMVMLSALPPQDRAQVLPHLKLVERLKLTLPDGTKTEMPLLHNGYVLGGGETSVDCSSLVSALLPADVRKGRLTTIDLKSIAVLLRTGKLPKGVNYKPAREKMIKEMAWAFISRDIYHGENPITGDLLLYRTEEPDGHVMIVQSYNPFTKRAEIIEAAQSAGTIRERVVDLSLDPMTWKDRIFIPGLWVLRLKSASTRACTYKEHTRLPASQRKKGGAS
jgi:hypothetical protein